MSSYSKGNRAYKFEIRDFAEAMRYAKRKPLRLTETVPFSFGAEACAGE